MSDPAGAAPDQGPNPSAVGFRVAAQYVKDLSFENPKAPQVFAQIGQAPPPVNIAVGVQVNQLAEKVYEVVLEMSAEAKTEKDNEKVFVVELTYAGVVETQEVLAPEHLAPLLMIEVPRLLFPFARAIMSEATRDGGFPPLMLSPVDFVALYRQRAAQAQDLAAQRAAGSTTA